jgi:hypothetical protein
MGSIATRHSLLATGPALARLYPHVVVWFDPRVSLGAAAGMQSGRLDAGSLPRSRSLECADLSAAIKLAGLRKIYSRAAL